MTSSSAAVHRRVIYAASSRLIGRTVGALISLLALREATRYFGPVHWGSITAALAWFGIFTALGAPGVATLAMRDIAKPTVDQGRSFGGSLAATVAVSSMALVAAAAVGLPVYWNDRTTLPVMLTLSLGLPAMAVFTTSGAVLSGRGRSDVRASLDVISSVLLLGATLIVVHAGMHQIGYASAYLGYLVVSAAIALGVASAFVHPNLRDARTGVRARLRQSLPLGQFDVFAAAYARADSIMLFFIKGSRSVALYGVAFQIVTFLFVTPSLLSNALLPDYVSAPPERKQFLARRGFDVMLTLALPLPIFGVLFGRPLVVWIAGDRFAPAGTILAILTGAALIAFLSGYLFQMAIFSGAERGLWRAIATVTAVNLTVNAVAVPLWGARGAAVAMILSESAGLVIYWRLYRRSLPSPLGRRYPLSVVAACAACVGVCGVLHLWLHVSSGTGAAMIPRAIGLLAVYLALVAGVAAAARRLASHFASRGDREA